MLVRRSASSDGGRRGLFLPGGVFGPPIRSGLTRCKASSSATSTRARRGFRGLPYLNVWTPTLGPTASLPVMVWIHGGGFVVGSGAEPRYDGTRLAAKGIVVVTLNHRLNALGFLAHPELTAELPERRFRQLRFARPRRGARLDKAEHRRVRRGSGRSDHRWRVRRVRSRQRADGFAPRSRPVPSRDRRERRPVPDAEPRPGTARRRRARWTGIHAQGGSDLSRRIAVAARERILAASPGLGFRPVVDGHFLPRPPAAIFAAGAQNDVPLLAGWNKDEGFNFSLLQGVDATGPTGR